ncbi:MAG: FliI/YscN family ATPase [Pseudomonadota bacterium]
MGLMKDLHAQTAELSIQTAWGRVISVDQSTVRLSGLSSLARVGDGVRITPLGENMPDQQSNTSNSIIAEIVAMNGQECIAYAYDLVSGIRIGDHAYLTEIGHVAPSNAWLGALLDPLGNDINGKPVPPGTDSLPLNGAPPPARQRRGFGPRMPSGINVIDTFLPLCQGQRTGLFAAPGVGKSSLISKLATRAKADIVVVALIGERGREVRHFYDHVLTDELRERTVVVAASSDEAAPLKRRAANLAMTTAEFYRDQGHHVLLLFDSLTRFADAHREIALAGGEPPSLRAYPPSTFQALARLVERAGPGISGTGDITALFSVLVAGGDMDEPVSDAVRGFLDGHIILDRAIAERGRFPAVDVLRSASRSLPAAASDAENGILTNARQLLGTYRDNATMVKAGLYEPGTDQLIDRAIRVFPHLDQFLAEESETPEAAFKTLSTLLEHTGGDGKPTEENEGGLQMEGL